MKGVKETGIIMSGNHPKLIQDGIKTMTRRVIKPCSTATIMGEDGKVGQPDWVFTFAKCPYGQVGDRLWVRETWYQDISGGLVCYKADYPLGDKDWPPANTAGKIKPSIFMPRWASRITREITGLRAERLQEISHQDAYKEGCKVAMDEFQPGCSYMAEDYRENFIRLWDSLNAKRGYAWVDNPWVWVISFKEA